MKRTINGTVVWDEINYFPISHEEWLPSYDETVVHEEEGAPGSQHQPYNEPTTLQTPSQPSTGPASVPAPPLPAGVEELKTNTAAASQTAAQANAARDAVFEELATNTDAIGDDPPPEEEPIGEETTGLDPLGITRIYANENGGSEAINIGSGAGSGDTSADPVSTITAEATTEANNSAGYTDSEEEANADGDTGTSEESDPPEERGGIRGWTDRWFRDPLRNWLNQNLRDPVHDYVDGIEPSIEGFKQGGKKGAYVMGNTITVGLDPRVDQIATDAWENAQESGDWLTLAGFYSGMIGGAVSQSLVIPMGGGGTPAAGGSRLVHLTSAGAGASINRSGTLVGNIYAGPLANAARSGIPLTLKTGLAPGAYEVAVPISRPAAGAFSRIVPIGPFTAWQRLTGQQYTARGVLSLHSGEFARQGVNWNQVTISAIDIGIDITAGTAGFLYHQIIGADTE